MMGSNLEAQLDWQFYEVILLVVCVGRSITCWVAGETKIAIIAWLLAQFHFIILCSSLKLIWVMYRILHKYYTRLDQLKSCLGAANVYGCQILYTLKWPTSLFSAWDGKFYNFSYLSIVDVGSYMKLYGMLDVGCWTLYEVNNFEVPKTKYVIWLFWHRIWFCHSLSREDNNCSHASHLPN